MAERKRDYRAEYAKRIARGMAKGLSRAQARGHPREKLQERAASVISGIPLRGAAKRAAERRQQRILPQIAPAPAGVRWQRTTPGGTRYVVTRDPRVVIAALEEARANGNDVLVNVTGEIVERSPTRRDRRNLGYASTGWRDPADLLAAIDSEPANVEAVIANACAEHGSIVASIDLYTVKERLR